MNFLVSMEAVSQAKNLGLGENGKILSILLLKFVFKSQNIIFSTSFVSCEKNIQENIQVLSCINVNKEGNKLLLYICKNCSKR